VTVRKQVLNAKDSGAGLFISSNQCQLFNQGRESRE